MTVTPSQRASIEKATGAAVKRLSPMSGGSVADVRLVELADGGRAVAKLFRGAGDLENEGWMLSYLAANSALPVPKVLAATPDVLLLEYIEGSDPIGRSAEQDAGLLLAALHGITAESFGLERDTLIGGLPQPNAQSRSWRDFFRDRRLLYMAHEAHKAGRLPQRVLARIEELAADLSDFIGEPERPSLIHGDMWGGNVLVKGGRIAGFVDPAIYYADPEIELAFATLFSTFGDSFFARYAEIRPIAPDFFEVRRSIYNLYPLLVHVRLFGGGYVSDVERTLARYGY